MFSPAALGAGAVAASNIVELVTRLAWPVLVAIVVAFLYPAIRKVIESRGFAIKVGGAEITVQQASDQLATQVDDVRAQLSALKAEIDAGSRGESEPQAPASPITAGVPLLRRVLWVDDHPENNVYEREALRRRGVDVVEVKSTQEAIRALDTPAPFDAIVSDMGRDEDGTHRADAGLELVRLVKERQLDVPTLIYTSAPAMARTREQALATGAAAVTSSGTELLDLLGRTGLR